MDYRYWMGWILLVNGKPEPQTEKMLMIFTDEATAMRQYETYRSLSVHDGQLIELVPVLIPVVKTEVAMNYAATNKS
jgi:hypothetical protein